jgi:hypothetical protein
MGKNEPNPPVPGSYEVGYGKPPVHTRFQKGQSGNPRGSSKTNTPIAWARQLMLEEAYRVVEVKDGDRVLRMPAIAAIFRAQLAAGLQGNGPAQRAALRMIGAIEQDMEAAQSAFLQAVIEYKTKADHEIAQRQARGITDMSDIIPHPDDLLIDMRTGKVYVKGDLNPKDAQKLRAMGLEC